MLRGISISRKKDENQAGRRLTPSESCCNTVELGNFLDIVCVLYFPLAFSGMGISGLYFARGVTGSKVFPIQRIGCEVSPLISPDLQLVYSSELANGYPTSGDAPLRPCFPMYTRHGDCRPEHSQPLALLMQRLYDSSEILFRLPRKIDAL